MAISALFLVMLIVLGVGGITLLIALAAAGRRREPVPPVIHQFQAGSEVPTHFACPHCGAGCRLDGIADGGELDCEHCNGVIILRIRQVGGHNPSGGSLLALLLLVVLMLTAVGFIFFA